MNENQESIITCVKANISSKGVITEEDLRIEVGKLRRAYEVSDDEYNEVIRELQHTLKVKMDIGSFVKERDHERWYLDATKNNKLMFWDRYRTYLLNDKNMPLSVVNSLDKRTDEMMDLLGNPNYDGKFSRKGLVIGDVQSGKTSTYIALVNKAADTGYKVIIILTGTIEKLRKQTQGRVDEGFVGFQSTNFQNQENTVLCGVGHLDPSFHAHSLTTTERDFSTNAAKQMGGNLESFKVPVVLVLKKNKSVLSKLHGWLKNYNSDSGGKVASTLLLIDDEADNASINTKNLGESPTAINAEIRKILNLFTKSNYVGFTATPFANIFINPDSNEEMVNQDLFPRDFIYALDAPEDYIGARDIYSIDGESNYMLKNNDDCEKFLPKKHKKDSDFGELPISLYEALASFFIANTIMDIRKEKTLHRSMLINITRFIKTQKILEHEIDSIVRDIKREVKYFCESEEANSRKWIKLIKEVFESEYKDIVTKDKRKIEWKTVLKNLNNSIYPIVIKVVNGNNKNSPLNYEENSENGLRVIVIGGLSLSRGLTLEGLVTSYFYRNSIMYDTLMQMGRWFGYRNGYKDLCRIWMSEESVNWYQEISEASDELRQEIKKMMNADLTPKDFGLSVRSNSESLIVTAVNKMRSATKGIIRYDASISGVIAETPYLDKSTEINKENYEWTKLWLNEMAKTHKIYREENGLAIKQPQLLGVDAEDIVRFLNEYVVSKYNVKFMKEDIVKIIEKNGNGDLSKWDVVIATGSATEEYDLGALGIIHPIERSFSFGIGKEVLFISGDKKRIGSVNFARGGLTKEQNSEIEKIARDTKIDPKKALNQDDYFKTKIKRNPLLIIYPTLLKTTTKANEINERDKEKEEYVKTYDGLWMGLGIGVPETDGKKIMVKYTINTVEFRNLHGDEEILGDEDDE